MREQKPTRLPIAAPLTTREIAGSGNYLTDSIFENCYIETQGSRVYVVKRPGLTSTFTYNGGGATAGQGTVAYQGALYAVGSNVLYRLNGAANGSADGSAWTASTSATWKARSSHVAVPFNGQIFMLGGINPTGAFLLNDVWASADLVHWSQQSSAAPWAAREDFAAAVLGNTLFIMGGLGATTYADVWSTTDGVNWKQVVGTAPWVARSGHAALAFNQGIVLMGGRDIAGNLLNDVWFSADGSSWTQLVQNAAWTARQKFGALVFNNKLWVAGGNTGGAAVATVYSSTDGITWVNTGSLPATRYSMLATVYAGKMWFIGGTDNGAVTRSTVFATSDGATFTTPTAAYGGGSVSAGAAVVWRTPTTVSAIAAPTIWLIGGLIGGLESAQIYRATLNVALPSSIPIGTSGATTDPFKTTTQNAGQYLILKNTADAWVYYAGQLQQISSSNYPQSTVPGIVNLDDTVYVMDSAGVIYGSNLSDPFTWSSLNFITADAESDTGIAIEKYQQYVVAFKSLTIQFFQDTGAYPGSPLKPIQNANMRVGCVHANSVVKMDNTIMFMATTDGISRYIAMFDGFSPARVSDASIDRILNSWGTTGAVYATNIKQNGHDFYLLTLVTAGVTLLYDIVEKQWHTWRSPSKAYFTSSNAATTGTVQYLQDMESGIVYTMSQLLYQDNGSTMTCLALGTKVDGGTNERKFCSSLTVVGDRKCSVAPNNIVVAWSDDDGQSYSAGVTVDLSQARPRVNRLGSFRRRQFSLTHASNNPMRLEALELEVG